MERPQRRGPLSAAIPLVRRLLRIQLTHVSFGVSETWLEVVNLQLRELVVGFGSLMQALAGAMRTTRAIALASGPGSEPEILRRSSASEDWIGR
jgi:hypothetical protein